MQFNYVKINDKDIGNALVTRIVRKKSLLVILYNIKTIYLKTKHMLFIVIPGEHSYSSGTITIRD